MPGNKRKSRKMKGGINWFGSNQNQYQNPNQSSWFGNLFGSNQNQNPNQNGSMFGSFFSGRPQQPLGMGQGMDPRATIYNTPGQTVYDTPNMIPYGGKNKKKSRGGGKNTTRKMTGGCTDSLGYQIDCITGQPLQQQPYGMQSQQQYGMPPQQYGMQPQQPFRMPSRQSYSGDYNSEGGKNKSRKNKSRKMRGGLSGKDRNGVLYNDQFGNPRPTMRTPDGYIIVRR